MSQRTPDHTEFGPNEWLVDELHQQYLADKNSVDPAWWEFFADYQPSETPHGQTQSNGATNGGIEQQLLPWWGGALVLVAYGLVFAALGALLTTRRDIT